MRRRLAGGCGLLAVALAACWWFGAGGQPAPLETPSPQSPARPRPEVIPNVPYPEAVESESWGEGAESVADDPPREFMPFASGPATPIPQPSTPPRPSPSPAFRDSNVAQVSYHQVASPQRPPAAARPVRLPPPESPIERVAALPPRVSGHSVPAPVRTAGYEAASAGQPFASHAGWDAPVGEMQPSFVVPARYLSESHPPVLQGATWDLTSQRSHVYMVDTEVQPRIEPRVLRDPLPAEELPPTSLFGPDDTAILQYPREAPLGYTGPSGILPQEIQTDSHFVPVDDRWREGLPTWDRYGWGHPLGYDYPYKHGRWWDPYNQNVLKGDFPVIGQHTFFELTVENISIIDARQVPTATTPFESTVRPGQFEFFGRPNQAVYLNPLFVSFELFHGDAGFKQQDWRIRITPVFNVNHLDTEELAVVNPDVREGTQRTRTFWGIEEWFVESKLFDLGTSFDFVSVRAGSQLFVSDFRGFVFNDLNRAVRVFGTNNANREQFNVIWFDQTEKDTNSQLNSFDDRHQNTLIANYFYQDFIWPGYTAQLSFHYNLDKATMEFDDNNFLVRPDPTGVYRPHEVNAYYLGWAGDGHINRLNISHAFYWALGDDELNPIAGKSQEINAQMAAVELSVDRDWARFRTSFFWASGDDDPSDGQAEGFDAILDNPNFAGGEFSFWQRQAIQLFGVRLVNDRSLVPNLRSSRVQGQTNFVNPGLLLGNVGLDMDLTPKTKLITNGNLLWFEDTEVLELFTFQDNLHDFIGADVSLGIEYRPLLNDNIEIVGGISGLIPGRGFKDLYNPLRGEVDTLLAGFMEVILIY